MHCIIALDLISYVHNLKLLFVEHLEDITSLFFCLILLDGGLGKKCRTIGS